MNIFVVIRYTCKKKKIKVMQFGKKECLRLKNNYDFK